MVLGKGKILPMKLYPANLIGPSEFEENQQLSITEQSLVHQPKVSELHTPCGFAEDQQLPSKEQSVSILNHKPELSEDHFHTPSNSSLRQNQQLSNEQQCLSLSPHQPEPEYTLDTPSDSKQNQQPPTTATSDDDIFSLIDFSDEFLSAWPLYLASAPEPPVLRFLEGLTDCYLDCQKSLLVQQEDSSDFFYVYCQIQ
ncbi:hypothetical protein OWV82_020389 [Melia azedarach]|uniref:Uncharacterized protein n=1 Tax=Melia azedarach TaxID=155640 RepID=A0ACC1X5Z0_MELAZ|nr:hypothetical protein OWV82_020389 [Melia azedarach]